jgi:hypothetical protein
MGKNMDLPLSQRLQALINEIKELADECVVKYGLECIEMSDGLLTAYLVSLLPEQDLDMFHRHKPKMLKMFRERAKEHMEWLNTQ